MTIARLHFEDGDFAAKVRALRQMPNASQTSAQVATIIRQVRNGGYDALCDIAKQLDGYQADDEVCIHLCDNTRAAIIGKAQPELLGALQTSAKRLLDYHRRQLPQSWQFEDADGNMLGERAAAVCRAMIYAPGGKAAYPSSVLMGVIRDTGGRRYEKHSRSFRPLKNKMFAFPAEFDEPARFWQSGIIAAAGFCLLFLSSGGAASTIRHLAICKSSGWQISASGFSDRTSRPAIPICAAPQATKVGVSSARATIKRTFGFAVGKISFRELAHSAIGAIPSAVNKGSASFQIRPLATAMVIITTQL